MATATIYANDANDGYMTSTNATYLTARTGSGVTLDSGTIGRIGQDVTGYTVYEVFMDFTTSSLSGSVVTAATLNIQGQNGGSGFTTFEVRAFDYGTLTTGDWVAGENLDNYPLVAELARTSFSPSSNNAFTDVALPANINTNGATAIVIATDEINSGTAPTGTEECRVMMAAAGNKPYLSVTYTRTRIKKALSATNVTLKKINGVALASVKRYMGATHVRPSFGAAGTPAVSTLASISPAWPTHAAGDLGILLVECGDADTITLLNANGFAAVSGSPIEVGGVDANNTQLGVFWCLATSSSMAAPEVADAGNHTYGVVFTVTGVHATAPIDVSQTSSKNIGVADTAVSVTGLTTTIPDCLIVYCASRGNDASGAAFSAEANSSLTDVAERFDNGTTSGDGGGLAVWTGTLQVPGASGALTATGPSTRFHGQMCLAIKP